MAVADISLVSVAEPARLVADAGSFTTTGQDAAFVYTAPTASVSWVSVDQGTYRLVADVGTFTTTGQDANLIYGAFTTTALVSLVQVQEGSLGNYVLIADAGSFTTDVAPSLSDHVMTASAGSFTTTGHDANLVSGISVNNSTGAVVFIPLRMATGVWSQAQVVDEANLNNLRTWLPGAREPIAFVEQPGSRPVPVYMNPVWYRYLDFVSNVKLGGAKAPTINDLAGAVVDSLNSAAQIESTQRDLTSLSEQNAQALAATVQVVKAESLQGSEYIPIVRTTVDSQ